MYTDTLGRHTKTEELNRDTIWGGAKLYGASSYTNNRRDGHAYDAAGNWTYQDATWRWSYDATGQQVTTAHSNLQMSYDGDRLRGKKSENGVTTYYLRSTVLGGAVVAELNAAGQWQRGYVYGGGGLLAIQQEGGVEWVHQDPVTKSQRLTNQQGQVTAALEFDPFGGETQRSLNSHRQPYKYTSYERDATGDDDAMHRRYNAWHGRFYQPDPYDGSYNLGALQSLNRYAYTQNDPVNFTDSSGLFALPIHLRDSIDVVDRVDPRIEQMMADFNDFYQRSISFHNEQRIPLFGPISEPPTLDPIAPQTQAIPVYTRNENDIKCDDKLAALFGGRGAKVATSYDPPGVQNGTGGLRPPTHSAAPYWNGNPKSTDRGGIIHVYGNDTGTAAGAALYTPSAGLLRTLPFYQEDKGGVYNEGMRADYKGLTIVFSHVEYIGAKDRARDKARGKTRIGNIGGIGGIREITYIATSSSSQTTRKKSELTLEQYFVRSSGFELFRFMSYAMNIKYFAFAFLLVVSSTNFAQQKGQEEPPRSSNMETSPTNCEYNGATLNFVHREAGEDGLIIAIARLGKSEQRRSVSRHRLRKVREYLVENWRRVSDTIVTAEGERVEGYGRIELYVGGKLLSIILVERNRDLAADSCQAGKLRYTGNKLLRTNR